jgi:CO dehydrogenase/acetyl-CoA synthase gamma subunit (corrinoid Fe-S protein)
MPEISDNGLTEVYKYLPRIDCGQCIAGSCLAFAKMVLEDCTMLSDCTRLSPYGRMLVQSLLCRGR